MYMVCLWVTKAHLVQFLPTILNIIIFIAMQQITQFIILKHQPVLTSQLVSLGHPLRFW